MHFGVAQKLFNRAAGTVRAVDGVSFTVHRRETLGLVGESGCGKSTVGRTIMGLITPNRGELLFRPTEGAGKGVKGPFDLTARGSSQRSMGRREIQMIFQDPNSSLNPSMRVHEILREPLRYQPQRLTGEQVDARIQELLHFVGLRPEMLRRYPHQFSGGQRQRIGIARALVLRPTLIIADEPVSALDVSVQGQILNLLSDVQRKFGLTTLFIAHDLSVIRHISDRVAVMYLGKIVELAPTDALYRVPKHPYTEALLSAVPSPRPGGRRRRIVLRGSVPSPLHPPSGCRFHTRCPYAREKGRWLRCSTEAPSLVEIGGGRMVACHFASDLRLRGVAALPSPLYIKGLRSSSRSRPG